MFFLSFFPLSLCTGASLTTKVWVFLIKALTYKKPQLYSYQASLPRLALPSLNQTLTRYLRSVKPLESEESYERLVREADEFENGIGKKLQLYLWLKSWWSSNYVRFDFDPFGALGTETCALICCNRFPTGGRSTCTCVAVRPSS